MEHPYHSFEQAPHDKERDSDKGSDISDMCYMVEGDDSLEVNSDFELNNDDEMPYDELTLLC